MLVKSEAYLQQKVLPEKEVRKVIEYGKNTKPASAIKQLRDTENFAQNYQLVKFVTGTKSTHQSFILKEVDYFINE